MECTPEHDQHLCMRIARREPIEELKKDVNAPKYICKNCGRASNDAKNVCAPEEL